MITVERVKELLDLNLRDERMAASALFISQLVARKRFGSGIEQYRIKNIVTDTWITSLEEFITQIDPAQLYLSYPYQGEKLQGDRVTGFMVTLDNLKVVWDSNARSDFPFTGIYDFKSQNTFQFYLAYMNDGDLEVPLKISFLKLIPA